MRIALILILGVATVGLIPCRANLGETMDQCIARYGKPLPSSGLSDPGKVIGEPTTFQQAGFNFDVYFINGVVEYESITKVDGTVFSDQERDKIVMMESTGGNWAKPVTAKGQLIWMRSDGAIIDCYITGSPLIMVWSKNYIQLASEHKKAHLSDLPSEAEVTKFIVPGISEDEVIQKYGVPMLRSPSGPDGELLIYSAPPPNHEMTYGYGGFEVLVKNGKVTQMDIVHQSVQAPK